MRVVDKLHSHISDRLYIWYRPEYRRLAIRLFNILSGLTLFTLITIIVAGLLSVTHGFWYRAYLVVATAELMSMLGIVLACNILRWVDSNEKKRSQTVSLDTLEKLYGNGNSEKK
jgi:hypothetical protein